MQASGLSSTVARACGMVVPFISSLGALWPPLPMIVLGSPFLLLSLLIWITLPEITDREDAFYDVHNVMLDCISWVRIQSLLMVK